MRTHILALTAFACLALSAHAQSRVPPVQKPQQPKPNLQPVAKPNNQPIQNRVQPIPINTPSNTGLPTLQQQQQLLLQQQQQILLQQQLLQQQMLQQQQNRNSGTNFFERGSLNEGQRRTHRVQLQADVTYSINLSSRDFDAFLQLQHNGRVIRQNDDGGNGLNSRIVFRPNQSGVYQVVVSALNNDSGDYTLAIRRE